jgi:hypothetical protein
MLGLINLSLTELTTDTLSIGENLHNRSYLSILVVEL